MRREHYGANLLKEKKPTPFWRVFLGEMKEPMNILLLVVGVLYSIFGEIFDALFVFSIIGLMMFIEATFTNLKLTYRFGMSRKPKRPCNHYH